MSRVSRLFVFTLFCVAASAFANVVEQNVNMVAGTQLPNGDPYLQRQNEPSVAVSSRNPLTLLALSNDYRSVDIPFDTGAPADNEEHGSESSSLATAGRAGGVTCSTVIRSR